MASPARAEYCRQQIRMCNELSRKFPSLRDHYAKLKQHYAAELIKAEGLANVR